jgi:hypothetical protein
MIKDELKWFWDTIIITGIYNLLVKWYTRNCI